MAVKCFMEKCNFISKSRIVFAVIISAIFVFYAFNFVPRNINIIASRNFGRQIFAYVFNFALFFIIIYSISCLFTYLRQKLFKRAK